MQWTIQTYVVLPSKFRTKTMLLVIPEIKTAKSNTEWTKNGHFILDSSSKTEIFRKRSYVWIKSPIPNFASWIMTRQYIPPTFK